MHHFSSIDFSMKIAWKHPVTDEPIFVLEDMPHVVKRVVNAMENSSLKSSKRNLKYSPHQPINLGLIETIWDLRQSEEAPMSLQETKLTRKHFTKDAFSRMRVSLSMQVLSASVAAMLEDALEQSDIQTALKKKTQLYHTQYNKLKEFIKHMNRFVDIANGRDPTVLGSSAPFTAESGPGLVTELLTILSFMFEWKASVESNDGMGPYNFFADETWSGICRVMFGYCGMIEYYCIKRELTINGKKTNSNPCEHHFARGRAATGSTNSGDVRSWHTHRVNETSFNEAKLTFVPMRSNNAQAPVIDIFNRKRY